MATESDRLTQIRERQARRRRQAMREYHLMSVSELLDDIDYLLSRIQPAGELTVESCLKELRELMPEHTHRIVSEDDPREGCPYMIVIFNPDGSTAKSVGRNPALLSLSACMSQVRSWHEKQQKGSK